MQYLTKYRFAVYNIRWMLSLNAVSAWVGVFYGTTDAKVGFANKR
jgi:hypothetical protein